MTDDMNARARVKRLEVENARLRQLVGDTSEFLHDMPSDGDAELDGLQRRCREALATPPPESETVNAVKGASRLAKSQSVPLREAANRFADAHPTPEQTGSELEKRNQSIRARYGLAPPAYREGPEPTGDALAALQRMKLRLPVSDECAYQHAADEAIVRRYLTASGVPYPVHVAFEPLPINVVFDGPPGPTSGRFVEVETDDGESIRVGEWIEREDGLWSLRIDCSGVPYVPEEARWLPVKWRNRVDDLSALESEVAANQRGAYCKCANELEAALASAPADGWKLVPQKGLEDTVAGWRVSARKFTDRGEDGKARVAYECANQLEGLIAAAPTHGGSEDD